VPRLSTRCQAGALTVREAISDLKLDTKSTGLGYEHSLVLLFTKLDDNTA
jgi:hypothetical protein